MTSRSWLASSSGRAVQTQAAAPATMRRGEARAGADAVAREVDRLRAPPPGRDRRAPRGRPSRRRARSSVTAEPASVAATVSTCGRLAGKSCGLPSCAPVARRRDDDRAAPDRRVDGVDDRVEQVAAEGAGRVAEAEVDHARAGLRRGGEPGDHGSEAEVVAVPDLEPSLRVDADEADAVHGRRDERADRGAVRAAVVVVEGDRVERDRVGPPAKLGVSEIHAGVDHRHGPSRGPEARRGRLRRAGTTTGCRRAAPARAARPAAGSAGRGSTERRSPRAARLGARRRATEVRTRQSSRSGERRSPPWVRSAQRAGAEPACSSAISAFAWPFRVRSAAAGDEAASPDGGAASVRTTPIVPILFTRSRGRP